MPDHATAIVIRADDVEPYTHPVEPVYHSQHVLGRESAGLHDMLLNRGTLDPRSAMNGGRHPDNDEIYYGLSGTAAVDLGGDPITGEGHRTFRIDPGVVVVIPAGTYHRLRNESATPFVVLTIWPQPAGPGANWIHDQRLVDWGTGFRLRDGCHLVEDGHVTRVVAPGQDWDPEVPS